MNKNWKDGILNTNALRIVVGRFEGNWVVHVREFGWKLKPIREVSPKSTKIEAMEAAERMVSIQVMRILDVLTFGEKGENEVAQMKEEITKWATENKRLFEPLGFKAGDMYDDGSWSMFFDSSKGNPELLHVKYYPHPHVDIHVWIDGYPDLSLAQKDCKFDDVEQKLTEMRELAKLLKEGSL